MEKGALRPARQAMNRDNETMGTTMKTSLMKTVGCGLAMGCLALALSACNTTKATLDTTVKFTSSTSPDDGRVLTEDGLIKAQYKVDVYAAVAFDNLEQDIARAQGEYVTSLGALLEVPADRRPEWEAAAQHRYAALFPDEGRSPETLAARIRNLDGR